MSDEAPGRGVALPPGPAGWMVRIAMAVGSVALLLAMGTEAMAVIGRHTRMPLVGSVEFVQACVVVATSSAIVAATVLDAHARVHLLTARLSPAGQARLRRLADLLSAAVFAVFAGGSIWLAAEMWSTTEKTQLLGVPLAPLRAFWCASAALTALLFLVSALKRRADEP